MLYTLFRSPMQLLCHGDSYDFDMNIIINLCHLLYTFLKIAISTQLHISIKGQQIFLDFSRKQT